MQEINTNLFARIKNKLNQEDYSYVRVRLEVSKIFFALVTSIYFFAYISTIGGFMVDLMGSITSAMFSVFVFSITVLIYDLCVYGLTIYTNKVSIFKIPLIIILFLAFALIISINYGLKI